MDNEDFFSGLKQLEREANLSFLFGAEIKNKWI
jgi:hypothetical protein